MSNGNNELLDNAGKVLGQELDTNEFRPDRNYRRWIFYAVVLVTIGIAVLTIIMLNYTDYPDIQIVYACEESIVVHEIRTNTFGKSRLAEETIIDYDPNHESFEGLEGRDAQIYKVFMNIKPELLVAEPRTLGKLVEKNAIMNATYYMEDTGDRDILCTEKYSVGIIRDIDYGISVKKSMYYEFLPNDPYIAVGSSTLVSQNIENKFFVVADFTKKIVTGEPYSVGRRNTEFDGSKVGK